MAKTENRPSWFKMFRNQKALIDSVPDAEVGQALKAVFQYFEDRTVIEMSPLVFAVFSSLKPYIDESYADFEAASKKTGKMSNSDGPNTTIPLVRLVSSHYRLVQRIPKQKQIPLTG